MSIDDDRRVQGISRIAFEALVEVGGSLGPTFEAQAVDISEEGMHLRTAYLPEVGQPLTCRFESGSAAVLATGSVVWREEAGRGGEFGIQFTNLDADSAIALDRIVGLARGKAPQESGAKVRLHIEGLGSPMRARVKDAGPEELRVGSNLGFLQVGKQLDLEDAATGSKRAARIDRVEVEIDPASQVPQLIVTLRYDEEAVDVQVSPPPPEDTNEMGDTAEMRESTPDPAVIDTARERADTEAPVALNTAPADDLDSIRKASDEMKGAVARGAAKVGPALAAFVRRSKMTLTLLASKRLRASASLPLPLRRMTAPPPGGGLHTSGRRVVRGDSATEMRESQAAGLPKPNGMKRKVIAGASIATVLMIAVLAMHKSTPAPAASASGAPVEETAAPSPGVPAQTPPAPAAQPMTFPPSTLTVAGGSPLAAPPAADVEENESAAAGGDKHHKVHVAPFGSGSVAHANVLRLKMDGTIEKLEGASTPTGFSVRLPSRRSLDAAAPLAARDGRIASIRITNEANGAELSVAFKDGVPNYQVRAKGDVLEIALASNGKLAEDTVDDSAGKRPENAVAASKKKHGKHLDRR